MSYRFQNQNDHAHIWYWKLYTQIYILNIFSMIFFAKINHSTQNYNTRFVSFSWQYSEKSLDAKHAVKL